MYGLTQLRMLLQIKMILQSMSYQKVGAESDRAESL